MYKHEIHTYILDMMSSHKEGWHVLDVYKPHRAKSQSMTVKTSSYCSNRLYYQLPNWMTGGIGLRELICLGRPYCKQLADIGELNVRKLAMWTQGQVQNLRERWQAARETLARSLVRFVLWNDARIVVDISSRC